MGFGQIRGIVVARARFQKLRTIPADIRDQTVQGSRWPSLFGLLYVTSLATASAVGVLPERFALYGLAVLALSWGQYRRWRTRGGLLVRERLIASSVVAGLLGPIDAVSAVLLASVVSGRKRQVVS